MMSQQFSTERKENKPAMSPREVFDLVLRERGTPKLVEAPDNSIRALGTPEVVARRKQPGEAVSGSDNLKAPLVDSAEIGPDGRIVQEKKARGNISKFEMPVVGNKSRQEAKPVIVDADKNVERAKQAVEGKAIQAKTAQPEKREIPPQVNIGADRLGQGAASDVEQKQEAQEPKIGPEITIDSVQPAPEGETIQIQPALTIADELDRTAGAPPSVKTVDALNSPNPVLKTQETAEQKDSAAQQTGEQVSITVNGAVQPDGEYFGSSDQKVSGQSGSERIRKIKEGINGNGNVESLEPPKYDKLDKEVEQVREETLREDGMDPSQVEINKLPVEPAKTVEQPKIEVSGGNNIEEDDRTRRLFMKRQPVRNPLLRAREYGRQPDITSLELSKLMPGEAGSMAEAEEPGQEELQRAA